MVSESAREESELLEKISERLFYEVQESMGDQNAGFNHDSKEEIMELTDEDYSVLEWIL
jgi:hypothetical protein